MRSDDPTLRLVRFFVEGVPVPDHRARSVGPRRPVRDRRADPWKTTVRRGALDVLGLAMPPAAPIFGTGPVALGLRFWLPRPKSHWRTGRNSHLLRKGAPIAPTGVPDNDNLVKAVKDALGDFDHRGTILWRDDAQVVGLDPAPYKLYAEPGQPTGVLVQARALTELPDAW